MQNLLDKINAHPRAVLIVAGTGIFGIATAVILIMFVSLRNTVVEPIVTPEVEKMVLSEVIKNNPKDLINNQTTSQTNSPVTPTVTSPIVNPVTNPATPSGLGNSNPNAPQPSVAPNLNEYNYRVTRVTYSKGPSYDVCRPYYGGGGMGGAGAGGNGATITDASKTVTEYYEYFERYLSEYKSQISEDGNLSSLVIFKNGRAVNTGTYYLNGNYAVENTFKPYAEFDNQEDTRVVSYPTSTSELIANYFGNNAVITNVEVNANGTKYYTISSSYSSYCDLSYDPYLVSDVQPPAQRTIITVYRVNGDSFTIEQVKKYIDKVSDNNLLDISSTEVNRSKVTSSQIDSQFKISSNVTLVKNDYSNQTFTYDSYKDFKDKIDYMSLHSMPLITPTDQDGLNYIYVSNYVSPDSINAYAFFNDRNFFPATAWGDTLFARFNNQSSYYSGIDYNVSLSAGYGKYYTVTAYNSLKTMDDLYTEALTAKATSKTIDEVTLDILGHPTTAKKVTRVSTYQYPASYAVTSYPASYPTNTYTTYYTVYLFGYADRLYSIGYYNDQNNLNFDTKRFDINPLATPQLVTRAYDRVVQLYQIYLGYWNPVSYPASYPTSFPSAPF